jgi:hypothetical protein
MSNDFTYDMSEINEETIFNGWQEMIAEDGSVWETGYDPIMGDGEGFDDTDDEWLDDYQGEEDFA